MGNVGFILYLCTYFASALTSSLLSDNDNDFANLPSSFQHIQESSLGSILQTLDNGLLAPYLSLGGEGGYLGEELARELGIKSGTRNPQIVWPFVDESDVLCVPCALFVQIDPTVSVCTDRLNAWIQAFYSIAVVQNVITTSLMAFRIWYTSARSAQYQTGSYLLPVARILIESAALQLVVEILLLALYSRAVNGQYFLQVAGADDAYSGASLLGCLVMPWLRANSTAFSRSDPVQTIGCMPMKHIKVDITTQMEDDTDPKQSFPESSVAHSSA
ncbi:hypothetical protein PLEOSDRAFT_1114134 [Pleurotus ostreatus PC15]|uniref:Uncharacterized protein n=1 Tax=Pleurotus ostreatus (strain PC15) TaxID=1137138 RepID=A0A067NJ81_PLEO1|nr:hypothetical protein PLEOSDRAFT_1114134 [Pleurotus ostreatus PC15]